MLYNKFAVVLIDKASGNAAFVCRRYYVQLLINELIQKLYHFRKLFNCIKANIQTVIDALNEINSRNEAISVATFGTKYSRVDQVKFLQDSL